MPESLDLQKCAAHMARRWRVIAASCIVAIVTTTVFTLLQTKQFTSRARVLIIPPTSESFPPTALSPTYMESLRTYEYLAMSDSLFKKAEEDLGIAFPHRGPLFSSFQRPVLEARIAPGTRILEISAALPDPQKAQALAAYIAAEVVHMSETSAAGSPASPSSRTEVLRLVDPGVVPASPDSSGLLFRVLAAFFAAIVLASVYLTFEFATQSQQAESLRKSMRVAGHG
jgi:uncharacterized protein involved in exopolysaccharide biosynthesis